MSIAEEAAKLLGMLTAGGVLTTVVGFFRDRQKEKSDAPSAALELSSKRVDSQLIIMERVNSRLVTDNDSIRAERDYYKAELEKALLRIDKMQEELTTLRRSVSDTLRNQAGSE